ncbi:hypothetical protein HMPREF9374_2336 [Desmospora sp. 8437]|nr:hypothetical protein HMPREF9374_2336 [Desmospora sp. 8437]
MPVCKISDSGFGLQGFGEREKNCKCHAGPPVRAVLLFLPVHKIREQR